MTDAQPDLFKEFAWGTKKLIDFKNSKGVRLQATLTLPAGYDPSKKYPMLVYFYELMSDTHHTFSFPVYDDRPHMSTYASNGYLVLQPDVRYEIGRPGSSALDCVTSAVKKVIELGYADPAHIGLQGHSWGGYQSSFIVTQTDIFAAVVTGAPPTDLTSFYDTLYRSSGSIQQGITEVGQVRMGAGVTPWSAHDLFESQSPVHKRAEDQNAVPDPAGHLRRVGGLRAGSRVLRSRPAPGQAGHPALVPGRGAPSRPEGKPEGLPDPHAAVLRSLSRGRPCAGVDDRGSAAVEEGPRSDHPRDAGGEEVDGRTMDAYTAQTKEWLDRRFRQTTEDGIFFAHQNIYGFKSPYCEDGVILRYTIFWNVLKALALLDFDSLLDVGGAEGYMSAVIGNIFGIRVRSCDLSEEACRRAREIFNIEADPVDGVALPYEDGSFDVVLSSECLEHIPQYEDVLKELLRVARKAVVITVPHDGPKAVAENIRQKVPHGHIHDFTLDSFRELVPASCGLRAWGLYSSFLRLPFRLVEGRPLDPASRGGWKRPLVRMLNAIVSVSGRVLNKTAFRLLMTADPFLSNLPNSYRQLLFILAKDPLCLSSKPSRTIPMDSVL